MEDQYITYPEFLGLAAVLASPVLVGVALFVAYWLRRRRTPALTWPRASLVAAISATITLILSIIAWLASDQLPQHLTPAGGMVLGFLFLPALVPGLLVAAATVGVFKLVGPRRVSSLRRSPEGS